MNLKIIFIGTSEFGAIILEKLCQADMKPALVVTMLDKPVGRKQILTPSPVKEKAKTYNISVVYELGGAEADLAVAASYGRILSKEILEIPKYGCLNVHPSLLPKYRGASPVQSAILNGEKETGVTIMLMDEGIDTGPVLSQRKTEIGPNETFQQLYSRLAVLGSELLIEAIPNWIEGKINPVPQDEKMASYSKVLTKEDGLIDWQKSPEKLDRQIRAFNPWPGVYTIHKNKRIKILRARLEGGKLIIEIVQSEGKKPTAFEDFKRGHADFLC